MEPGDSDCEAQGLHTCTCINFTEGMDMAREPHLFPQALQYEAITICWGLFSSLINTSIGWRVTRAYKSLPVSLADNKSGDSHRYYDGLTERSTQPSYVLMGITRDRG
jgi:hypothetical protein